MAKFHINSLTGAVSACSASKRPCPFGSPEEHYPTAPEARAAYEAQQAAAAAPPRHRRETSLEAKRAEKFSVPRSWEAAPEDPSLETLRSGVAFAKATERYVPLGFKETLTPPAFAERDEWDEGGEYHTVGTRTYLLATPQGSMVEVTYKAHVETQHDDYWEYHPSFSGTAVPYASVAKYRKREAAGGPIDLHVDDSAVLDEPDPRQRGSVRPAYDRSSSKNVLRTAEHGLSVLPKPEEAARVAELSTAPGKLPGTLLTSSAYLGSSNPQVRAAAVARKEFPAAAHALAREDASARVRVALAKRSDLSAVTMAALLEPGPTNRWGQKSTEARDALLQNPKLPASLANKHVREGTVQDLRALAHNPALTPAVRERLEKKAAQLGVRIARAPRPAG